MYSSNYGKLQRHLAGQEEEEEDEEEEEEEQQQQHQKQQQQQQQDDEEEKRKTKHLLKYLSYLNLPVFAVRRTLESAKWRQQNEWVPQHRNQRRERIQSYTIVTV